MNAQTSDVPSDGTDCSAPFASVAEALAAVPGQQWQRLAKFAETLLRQLRHDPNLARYLAGVTGEEIVDSTVLAVQIGAVSPGTGRKVDSYDLKNGEEFFRHLQGIVRSMVDNYRRHQAGTIPHDPIGCEDADEHACDPADASDLPGELAIRDLLRVLLPRVIDDLQNKPKQLAVMQSWVASLGRDDILPSAGQSKFVRHCVRTVIRRHLRELAARDLQIDQPTGKELLS